MKKKTESIFQNLLFRITYKYIVTVLVAQTMDDIFYIAELNTNFVSSRFLIDLIS